MHASHSPAALTHPVAASWFAFGVVLFATSLACGGGGEAPVGEVAPEPEVPVRSCDIDTYVSATHPQVFIRREPGLDKVAIDAVPAGGNVHLTGSREDGWLRLDVAYDSNAQEIFSGEAWIQPDAAAVFLVNALNGEAPNVRTSPSRDAAQGEPFFGEVLVRGCEGGWVRIDEGEPYRGWVPRNTACGVPGGGCGQ